MHLNSKLALALVAGAAIGGAAIQTLHAQAKPPAFAVVEIDVTNQDAFLKEYAPIAGKALTEAGGKYLARGGKNVGIDGEPPKSRTIILAFENIEKAQAAFASPGYREGRKIGDKYAKFRVWAMEGLTH
jgi:uncharacterized protein (DUF1330 family)